MAFRGLYLRKETDIHGSPICTHVRDPVAALWDAVLVSPQWRGDIASLSRDVDA
jgi:hypothetical protein